ncbi:MotA/TolQ/ExbB proton channel family protein [Moritella dasanensis]|uniref:MotA/TolQ/ExbB proton channel family protein n=1 Tax=Moritella dasanensis TaxID=428031 RepID=UPI0002F3C410|nr:MotA/TolQ/ExbB proton channel family protein [Moritella dasanensis]
MNFFNNLYAQLGLMTWPLTLMSCVVLLIILERLLYLSMNSRSNSQRLIKALYQQQNIDGNYFESTARQLLKSNNTFEKGAGILLMHHDHAKNLREETVSLWLHKQRRNYGSGLKILSIIGMIAPLIGLLGTVLGLIKMFKDLALTQGTIEPALLADGLGLAMATTAAGLLIALPAILGSQLLHLWADNIMAKVEHALNHCNLFLEGVYVDQHRVEQYKVDHIKGDLHKIKTTSNGGNKR